MRQNGLYFVVFIMMRICARFEENSKYFMLITALLFSFKSSKTTFIDEYYGNMCLQTSFTMTYPPPPKSGIFADPSTKLKDCTFFQIAPISVDLQKYSS